MNFEIESIRTFDKQAKRLSKKYPSLKTDLLKFAADLFNNPGQGKPLGKDCFKVRLQISSKNKGKSGGGRIVTCVRIVDEVIYLLTIYDKSEKEGISDAELNALLSEIEP